MYHQTQCMYTLNCISSTSNIGKKEQEELHRCVHVRITRTVKSVVHIRHESVGASAFQVPSLTLLHATRMQTYLLLTAVETAG